MQNYMIRVYHRYRPIHGRPTIAYPHSAEQHRAIKLNQNYKNKANIWWRSD